MNRGPILTPWLHNASVDADLIVIGADVVAGFDVDDLVDGDPANGMILSAPSALILHDYGSAVHIAVAALLHHNLDAGLAVSWRGYSALPTSLSDPADLTVPVTIGALEATGYRPNVWADIDAVAPLASYRYQGWAITGTNSRNIAVGEIVTDTARRQLATDFLIGATVADAFGTIRNTTYAGVALKAQKAGATRLFRGRFIGPLSEIAAIREAFLALAGSAQNALYIPDPDGPDVHLVEFAEDSLELTYEASQSADVYSLSCAFRELSRGLAWA